MRFWTRHIYLAHDVESGGRSVIWDQGAFLVASMSELRTSKIRTSSHTNRWHNVTMRQVTLLFARHFSYCHTIHSTLVIFLLFVEASWNMMAHVQKPDFVFRRNGRVHLNRRGRQFSRLLAAEVCASTIVKLNTPCSEVVWRVLATHSIRQFPLHFPSRASPCAITFQLVSNNPAAFDKDVTIATTCHYIWFCLR
jgi:hypothetical protein